MSDNGTPHDAGVAEAVERVKLGREVEAEDRLDTGLAERALQSELGDDYEQARRMLQQHVRGMSQSELAQLDPDTFRDPDALRALGERALGPLPQDRAGQEAEIAEARRRMASDKTWYQDDRAQLRYRRLLQMVGEAT